MIDKLVSKESLSGLNVLITGGSRGIGKSCVELFNKAGADVQSPTRDFLDLKNPAKITSQIKALGNFDVLILNAGINEIKNFEQIEKQDFTEVLQVNSFANMEIVRENIMYMKENRWGRIVFLSSLFESRAKVGRAMYSMSKAMNLALIKNLALEYGKHNILTNAVTPGFVLTDLTKKNNSPQEILKIEEKIPVGRLAKPEEIAELCLILGSPINTYINGQSIIIDGGYSCQ